MRVGILGLLQESNTFLPSQTTWDHFAQETLARREAIRDQFYHTPHEVGGFFAGLENAGVEAVPLFLARALPYGTIAATSFERLMESMFGELEEAGPLDGILAAVHGATVSERFPDADGYWLSRVRKVVGPNTPLVGTLDPHANLSPQMVQACNALIAYRTNPHIDQRDRGQEAADLMVRMLHKEVHPEMAAAYPPLAISIECQSTAEYPCHEFFQRADRMHDEPDLLSNSILLGFPYADVAEMGSAVIAIADHDHSLAQRSAHRLANAIWERRHDCVAPLLDVEAAMRQITHVEPPVCLLDMGDNVGGGSPGDGTWLAQALCDRGISPSLVTLYDPMAVRAAQTAGVGATIQLSVGGHCGESSGKPLRSVFGVQRLHDGKFSETRAVHGGYATFDQGLTAVLKTQSGLTVVATSKRMVPFSLAQLTSCGIEPEAYRVLVAKGVNAPIAAYQPVCRSFLRVHTPGTTSADMTQLAFTARRRPMFPFEPETRWRAEE